MANDPIDLHFQAPIISRLKVMSELDISERRIPQDGRFKIRFGDKSIDFRVSIMPSSFGEDAVIRILDKESIANDLKGLTLENLGISEREIKRLRKKIREPYGMVLVTGPTGSGKTTTLYAALTEIHTGEDKIITIEDPVEYMLRGILQIPVNEKEGTDLCQGSAFDPAPRSRQDHGRRDPRPGDRPDRGAVRPDRSSGVYDGSCQQCL